MEKLGKPEVVTNLVKLPTRINYYGGKSMMSSKIIQLIPPHEVYTECFFGGGVIFFAKEKVAVEAINDINSEVINFYQVSKSKFKALQKMVQETLFAEETHKRASVIYNNPKRYTDIERAWAFFVLSQQSFLNIIDNSWKFNRNRNNANLFTNKKALIDDEFMERLESTQIFCRDANRVLMNMDCEEAFHFLDPPYFQANMGHYGGYTEDDFEELLKTCEKLQGYFMLTTFPSQILEKYRKRNHWYQIQIQMPSSAKTGNNVKDGDAVKTEVITMNYKPTKQAVSMFEEKLKPRMAA